LHLKIQTFSGGHQTSDILVTETEMIKFRKIHTETNTEKIFNTDTELN